jgi:hypothetical protein
MPTFEQLLQLAKEAPLSEGDDKREIQWCEGGQILGISRQPSGAFEIFLCGEKLQASSVLVRRHLKFDRWSRAGGVVFQANRLVFPSDDHFVPMVAFLTEELLRSKVSESISRAFAQTEPLLEMALRRIALSEEELLGLLGELRFLEVLLAVAETPRQRALAFDAWRGYERTSRDFVVGQRAVEVKATRGNRSLHRISNVMQVDPRRSASSEPQEELFLLSLGFKPLDDDAFQESALSLPTQVEAILSKLRASGRKDQPAELDSLFLNRVACYGSGAGGHYAHEEMRNWSTYRTPWSHGFVRIYDMSDMAVQVLRRDDVKRRGHVVLESVNFEVDLPDRISGDLNPETDLFSLARRLLA